MWIQVKSAPNLMMAEMWKEFFEAEGIPTRILPASDEPGVCGSPGYHVLVTQERVHVVEEVLRKL